MKNLCENLNDFKTPHRSLIGSYFGKQITVTSSLLKWYCYHGLIVSNITAFICYEPVPCFRKFLEVAAMHQKVVNDKAETVAGNTAEVIGKLKYLTIVVKKSCFKYCVENLFN